MWLELKWKTGFDKLVVEKTEEKEKAKRIEMEGTNYEQKTCKYTENISD